MIRGTIYRQDNLGIVVADVMQTTRIHERMRGLLGQPPLSPNQGLLINPCSSVHTFGMSYAIDLVYLNKNWNITKLVHSLKPNRLSMAPGSSMVVELPGGKLSELNLNQGLQLHWETI